MLQPGTILDNKYRIEAVIGRGGFGHVYRARERLTGEVVAIKELLPSLFYDGEIAQRFIQEARATLRLTHSHIARSFGVFHDQNTYYLAMEFLPGGSLADRLKRGSLPVPEVLRIARDLCQALAYAHQEGVIHCDIKPGNVLFDERGRAHLADFGIAHVSTDLMTRRLFTATGVTMGTVRHMAPEQLEGVRDDPRLDVYAVGTVLYEMIAGRPYLDFEEETTPAAQMRNMQRIQTALPRPLRALCPTVPGHVVGAVERALQKAPTDRFNTIDGLAQALQRPEVLAPEPAVIIPSEERPESAARPGPSVKRPVAEKRLAEIAGADAPPDADQRVPPAVAPKRPPRLSPPVVDLSPVKHLWAQLVDAWRLAPDWVKPVAAVGLLILAVAVAGIVAALAGAGTGGGQGAGGIDLGLIVSDRSGKREIHRLTPDGTVIQVTHTSDGESWAPAEGPGDTMYFTSDRDRRVEIYRLDADGAVVRVTHTAGGISWFPAVGPGGTLYFTSERGGPREIHRLDADGAVQQVTHTQHGESWGAAAGPGGTLYFTSNRGGPREIYRLRAEGGVERVTHTEGESWAPAVGRDGTLYFCSNRDGGREIYRIDADGAVVRVTHTERGESWAPAVGARGTLWFTSDRDGPPEVYRVRPGGEVERVTHTVDGASWLPSEE